MNRDNPSIVWLATLEHDKAHIERTIHPRELEPWFLGPVLPDRNEQFVRNIISHKDNFEETTYDAEIAKVYSLAIVLKLGEKLVWWWRSIFSKFERRDVRAEVHQIYAND